MRTLAEMRHFTQQMAGADGLLVTPGSLTHLEDAFIGLTAPGAVDPSGLPELQPHHLALSTGATVALAERFQEVAGGAARRG